jgi:hypothetical protein
VRDVKLTDYPWLIHELGHAAFFANDKEFRGRLGERFARQISTLRLKSIADSNAARERRERLAEELRGFWSPTPDHENWAHEIAMDMVGTIVGGPAYLAGFLREVQKPGTDPYQISSSHPPYATRAQALLIGAKDLGWHSSALPIEALLKKWETGEYAQGLSNNYFTFTADEFFGPCCEEAWKFCVELGFPRCTSADLADVQDSISRGELPEWGVPILLGAWHQSEVCQPAQYAAWEKAALNELIELAKP